MNNPTLARADELHALAQAVLLPGFSGHTVPDWLRRRLSESLGGVCLFARNISSARQLGELTASLRADRGPW